MSEGEGEQTGTPTQRKIKIKIDDSPARQRIQQELDKVTGERDEAKQTLEALANAEFEKELESLKNQYPDRMEIISQITTPSQLEMALEMLPREHGKSTGVVPLLQQNKDNILTKQFRNKQEAFEQLAQLGDNYDASRIKDELLRKFIKSENMARKTVIVEKGAKVKSPSNRYFWQVNKNGMGVLIPHEHRNIKAEELKRRIDSGVYG